MYDFINPYNFIPFGSDLEDKKKMDKREYYRGEKQKELLSGWLHVNMDLKTPLIIPDGAHPDYWEVGKHDASLSYIYNREKKKYEPDISAMDPKEMKKGYHLEYSFFKQFNPESQKEEYAIPGSEIRGMIRSAYESVTNSCIPFLMDDKKISQRVPLFAALHKRGLLGYDGGKWILYKTEKELEEVMVLPLYKINGSYYVPSLESVRNNTENQKKNKDGADKYKIMRSLDRIDNVLKEAFKREKPYGKIIYGATITQKPKNKWNVSIDGEEKEIDEDGEIIRHYFVRADGSWITDKPGVEVHNRGVIQYNVPVDISRIYHVAYLKRREIDTEDGTKEYCIEKTWEKCSPEENEEAYQKLLSAIQRDGAEKYLKNGKRQNKQPNRYCNMALEDALKKACEDPRQLVPVYYFSVKTGEGDDDKEVYMSGSAAGRIAQHRKWENIFSGHLPCKGDRLCPACLLFGTSSDDNEHDGMKGHVRFSDAFLSSPVKENITSRHTLKILSTPKPTAFEFYLGRPVKDAVYWNYDFYEKKVGKGDGTKNEFYHLPKPTPRGRKIYWHHQTIRPDDRDKGKMNCTVEAMNAGEGRFSFDVYFDQITNKQLMELIWVITLGDNRADSALQHKLGHAKPLGYGSVKLTIDRDKSILRRFSISESGTCRYEICRFSDSLEFSKENMVAPFDESKDPVKSFLIMCNHNVTEGTNFDYPRMKYGGKIFEWFSRNRENALKLKTLPYLWEEDNLDSNYECEEEKGVVWIGDYDLTSDQAKRLAQESHMKISARKKKKGSTEEAIKKYANDKYIAVALSYDLKKEDQDLAKEAFARVWVSTRKQKKGRDIGWNRLK